MYEKETGEWQRKTIHVLFDLKKMEESFFMSSTILISTHCEFDFELLPRLILALPWNQSDNNNNATTS